jgi:hypothetical protein
MKSYFDVLGEISKSSSESRLSIAVFFTQVYSRHEWLPVDKRQYIEYLSAIEPQAAKATPYPCWFEIDNDGDMFIHPNVRNSDDD